jgi:hypothetical protein
MSLFSHTLALSLVSITAAGCFVTGGDSLRRVAENYDPNRSTFPAEAPPPASFPAAEPMVHPAVKAWATGANITVLRAYLMSTAWDMERHPGSGRVLGRKATMRLYYRGANGPKERNTDCYRKDYCVLYQDNLGGDSWSDPTVKCEGAELGKHHVDCSSIDALRGTAP